MRIFDRWERTSLVPTIKYSDFVSNRVRLEIPHVLERIESVVIAAERYRLFSNCIYNPVNSVKSRLLVFSSGINHKWKRAKEKIASKFSVRSRHCLEFDF